MILSLPGSRSKLGNKPQPTHSQRALEVPLHTTALPILGYQPHGWKIHRLVWRFPQNSVYIYIKYGSASHLWLPKGIYPKSILIRTHTHVYIYNITMLINRRFIDCYRMEGSSWRSPKNSGPRCDQNWNAGLGEQQRLGQDNPGSTLTVHGHVWDISLSNVGKALIDRPYFDGLESIPTIYGKLKGWATITLPTLYHYKATWNNINSFWIDPCGMRYLQTYQCMSKT